MFSSPQVWVFVSSLLMTIAYFVLMTPAFDLKLSVFLAVSLMFTAVQVALGIAIPSWWTAYGGTQCLLFDVGVTTHLLNGKRTVKDVVGPK